MPDKNLYIIAGCNGAGKTTASFTILPQIIACSEFVNADEIPEVFHHSVRKGLRLKPDASCYNEWTL